MKLKTFIVNVDGYFKIKAENEKKARELAIEKLGDVEVFDEETIEVVEEGKY